MMGWMRKSPFSIQPLQASTAVSKDMGTRIFIIQTKPLHPLRAPAKKPSLRRVRRVCMMRSLPTEKNYVPTREIAPHFCTLARIFHELLATTTDMAILPGVLARRTLRRTVQVRLGSNSLRLPGGTSIFVVSRQQFMKYPG